MPDSVMLASFSPWKYVGDVSGSDLNFKGLGELSFPVVPEAARSPCLDHGGRRGGGLGNGIPPQPLLSELNSKG